MQFCIDKDHCYRLYGVARGLKHCTEVGCLREQLVFLQVNAMKCVGIHAEQNAIIQAALHGGPPKVPLYIAHINHVFYVVRC